MYASFPLSASRLRDWSAVEDTRTVEGFQRGNIQSAVRRAGCQDHRSRTDLATILDRHPELVRRASKGDRPVQEHEARPEGRRLLVGLLGKPAAADALGEAQVVTDQRARPGLSTDAALIQDEDAQPLRGAIDGRRQARRPCADDDHVVGVLPQSSRGPRCPRDLRIRRVVQDTAVREHHQGELLRFGPCAAEQLTPLVRIRQAEGVRNRALLEHLSQLVGSTRPGLADDMDRLWDETAITCPLEQEARDG